MRLVVNKPGISLVRFTAVLLAALCAGQEARANVFASNIKLNGGLGSITNSNAAPVTISYILNEPATLGTTISILSGATVVDSINVASGSPGALKGTNAVVWGATNTGGSTVGGGIYSVSITPAASGYTNWAQITTDTNAGNYIYWPAGIAVDRNTNSLYYGRVMVANSGPDDSGTNYGDTNGIIKLNADASFADEGQSNAGYAFVFDGTLGEIPRRGRIGADDRFYFNDWSGNGKVVAVDMLMTTNQVIIDSENFTLTSGSEQWPEFDVTDVGTTNARVYMADFNLPGQGVWSWPITNNGAADPVDDGIQVVRPDGNGTVGTDIPSRSVFGLMLDENKDIFLGNVQTSTSATPRATCITNWTSSTNLPLYTNNILWQVGQSDNTFNNIADLAIDSRANPHYVAYAMNAGLGGMRILNAATGTTVTNLQQDGTVYFLSAGWDRAGNVYAGCATNLLSGPGFWRTYSPPGTNQSTTLAVETIQIIGTAPLIITGITRSNTSIVINFTGASSDSPSTLAVLGSATAIPASGFSAVAGASIVQVSSGVFQATVPMSGAVEFYRIKRGASAPVAPTIKSINVSAGTVTINFIGSASDPATAFTLMSCSTEIPASSYAAAAGAQITASSPGIFQATVAASGSMQFYRLKR